ncbi:MAG: GNAT family N-acetyltransferase [Oscillospiraceae bacterium]|nr:GNAT family N-acetyltransferase [Oscillospiraceae bacterium]
MIFRVLRPEELELFVAHCAAVFSHASADYFRNHQQDDPNRESGAVFIAEDAGRIVASVCVFAREIYIRGQPVRVGGIGDVATVEAYRRQGLSAALLKMAIEHMNANDMPVSLLFTGRHDHYGRQGWFSVCKRRTIIDLRSLSDLPARCSLYPLTPPDFGEAMELYQTSARRLDGTLVRNPAYWERWVPHSQKNPVALKDDNDIMLAWMDVDFLEDKKAIVLTDYASQAETEWLLPMMNLFAQTRPAYAYAAVPAPLLPHLNGPYVEENFSMFRLNRPFALHGTQIDTAGKLAAALSDSVYWQTDVF